MLVFACIREGELHLFSWASPASIGCTFCSRWLHLIQYPSGESLPNTLSTPNQRGLSLLGFGKNALDLETQHFCFTKLSEVLFVLCEILSDYDTFSAVHILFLPNPIGIFCVSQRLQWVFTTCLCFSRVLRPLCACMCTADMHALRELVNICTVACQSYCGSEGTLRIR